MSTFVGDGFVGVCLNLVCKHYSILFGTKCGLPEKRRMWVDLVLSKGGFMRDICCVLGDFNAVTTSRRGEASESLLHWGMRWRLGSSRGS